MEDDKTKLVTVYTTTNEAIISFIKSILDDNEINYVVKGENWHETFPVTGAGGNIEVQVMESDEERVRELVKDVEETLDTDYEDDEEESEEKIN